jgi:hypothetical protein
VVLIHAAQGVDDLRSACPEKRRGRAQARFALSCLHRSLVMHGDAPCPSTRVRRFDDPLAIQIAASLLEESRDVAQMLTCADPRVERCTPRLSIPSELASQVIAGKISQP